MKKLSFVAAIAAATVATPAMAQDLDIYAGGIVGYDSVEVEAGGVSESSDDVMYGIVAGADYQINNTFFIGLEGEYSDSSVSEDAVLLGDDYSLKADRNLYVGARLGGALAAGTKVYIKGGYSNFKVSGYVSPEDLDTDFKASDDLDGWVIGAGVEQSITDKFRVRAEYRYTDYGDTELFGYDTGLETSRHQGVVGVLYSF